MEEGTRNTIVAAAGLGLVLSYGLPKLFPLQSKAKQGKLLSAHPTISEIDPSFPQISLQIQNLPMDYDKVGRLYYDTIPFQMISQSRSGRAGNVMTGNAKRPTYWELREIVAKTTRIQILGGTMPLHNHNKDGVRTASGKSHWQKTANELREQGLLSPNNIEQMAHAPFDWGDLGLDLLIDVPTKTLSIAGWGSHPLYLKPHDFLEEGEEPNLLVRLHPKNTKVNLAKWDMVSELLRTGGQPDGNLVIMLTDDDLFRCYIPIGSRISVGAALPIWYDGDGGVPRDLIPNDRRNLHYHKFSDQTFRPATGKYSNEKMSNFKKAKGVVHRYNASAVFLMPYEFSADSTYANVYNSVFNRSVPIYGLSQRKWPGSGFPEAYNQNGSDSQ